jgi:RNA recognition motif-containing protein
MTTRIYVGNLPLDIKERELDDLFYKVRKDAFGC